MPHTLEAQIDLLKDIKNTVSDEGMARLKQRFIDEAKENDDKEACAKIYKKLQKLAADKQASFELTQAELRETVGGAFLSSVVNKQFSASKAASQQWKALVAHRQTVYQALEIPFRAFKNKIRSALTEHEHQKAVDYIILSVEDMLQALADDPSAVTRIWFKDEIYRLLAQQKEIFKDTPWIWHDVINPAFQNLIRGVLFVFSLGFYEYNLFQKPDSAKQVLLNAEFDGLNDAAMRITAPG